MSIVKKAIVFSLAALATTSMAGAAEWKPEKPINLIVPWGAGGATDLVTRIVAGALEGPLGQKVVVINQPGASGAIGSKAAMDAEPDGYTWTAGAAKDLGTYAITGRLDTKIQDWNLFLSVANVNMISVNPNSGFEDMGQFLEALKGEKRIAVGTSGVNSAGHSAMEGIIGAAGGAYKHVSYEGGAKAVLSTVSGETQVSSQLISEQLEMVRGKRLVPLAALTTEPVELPGVGVVPPITNWLPNFKPSPIHFGIFVPKGVPADVIETLEKIWASDIANSEALKSYADSKGAALTVMSGEEAQAAVAPSIQINAWQLFDSGQGNVSPETIGITRP
ncbi:tripartite tricarboxylate transporter substrate binding protein [Pseudovibrio sp. Tun.PSC04-5.I4]|uniref:Bug family tripartite tricarboxylate transporter substrate binding protein n=1 Tax=Pseudovibrio sp. Tun.PSC04-5.I4 TaxID=1798213 RepID=UPI0008809789|nr:tripartite tricarboxylate transporter substrate binding protein [Pseudovibrio sp. Tun.PSC04-5.I4]SDQ16954.1 Tripartite-type tricarboxylate transporter, receptor component TctC [Pseudovibrio sp. Tun.PSC04-5.I4]